MQLEIATGFHFDNAHWDGTVQPAIVDFIVARYGDWHPFDLVCVHKEIGPIPDFVAKGLNKHNYFQVHCKNATFSSIGRLTHSICPPVNGFLYEFLRRDSSE